VRNGGEDASVDSVSIVYAPRDNSSLAAAKASAVAHVGACTAAFRHLQVAFDTLRKREILNKGDYNYM
jgi:hypothetical protein